MEPIRIPLSGGGESFLPVNEENYLSLRKAYRKAVAEGKEQFEWEVPSTSKSTEHYRSVQVYPLYTIYAKYILEYMEMSPLITETVKVEPDPEEDE